MNGRHTLSHPRPPPSKNHIERWVEAPGRPLPGVPTKALRRKADAGPGKFVTDERDKTSRSRENWALGETDLAVEPSRHLFTGSEWL